VKEIHDPPDWLLAMFPEIQDAKKIGRRSFPIYRSEPSEQYGRLTFTQPSDGRPPIGWILADDGSALRKTQFRDPNGEFILELFGPNGEFSVTADEARRFAEDGLEGLSFEHAWKAVGDE
jgi:hypothetical protein